MSASDLEASGETPLASRESLQIENNEAKRLTKDDYIAVLLSGLSVSISFVSVFCTFDETWQALLAWSTLVCILTALPLISPRYTVPLLYRTIAAILTLALVIYQLRQVAFSWRIILLLDGMTRKYRKFHFANDLGITPDDLRGSAKLAKKLEFVRLIGAGGYGAVYLVREKASGRLFALKRSFAPFSWLLFREPYVLSRLARNEPKGIVRAYQAAYYRGGTYILMDYVDAWQLTAFLRGQEQEGSLTEDQKRRIARGLVEAVGGLQASNVVFRDFTSLNVLIDKRSFSPVLIDFGNARMADEKLCPDTLLNNLIFHPVEAVVRQEWTFASDIWSLAVNLSSLYIGAPFGLINHGNGVMTQEAFDKLITDQMQNAGYFMDSPESNLLLKLFRMDPRERLQNFASILHHPYFTTSKKPRRQTNRH